MASIVDRVEASGRERICRDSSRRGEFRAEIEGAREGSDLHWFLRKIAEKVSEKYLGNLMEDNWNLAQRALLSYAHCEISNRRIGQTQTLTDYLTQEWNEKARELSQGRHDPQYWILAQEEMAKIIVQFFAYKN